jgi:hypothetical protein
MIAISLLQNEPQDYPPSCDVVCPFPAVLRNTDDLLHERGIDVSHEAVRYWWHRLGPMFAAEVRKRRVRKAETYPHPLLKPQIWLTNLSY